MCLIHCIYIDAIKGRETPFSVISQVACKDDKVLQSLGEAATSVTQALNDMLQHIKRGTGDGQVIIRIGLPDRG